MDVPTHALLSAAATVLRRAESATRRAERLLTPDGCELPWAGAVRDAGEELGRCAEGCERYGRQG